MGHWVWHPHSNSNPMERGEGGHAQKIPINHLRTSRKKKHNVNRQPVFLHDGGAMCWLLGGDRSLENGHFIPGSSHFWCKNLGPWKPTPEISTYSCWAENFQINMWKRSVFLFLNIVRCWMFQFAWFRKFSRKKHVTNKYTCENLETFIEYPDVWMRYSASPISGQKSEAAQVILPEFCYISIRLPRSLSQ